MSNADPSIEARLNALAAALRAEIAAIEAHDYDALTRAVADKAAAVRALDGVKLDGSPDLHALAKEVRELSRHVETRVNVALEMTERKVAHLFGGGRAPAQGVYSASGKLARPQDRPPLAHA